MATRGRASRYFMGALGTIMGLLAVAFPLTTLAHGIGLIEHAPPWGFWSSLFGMLFAGVTAVEMFTGHIGAYAGDLLRTLAKRLAGTVVKEKLSGGDE